MVEEDVVENTTSDGTGKDITDEIEVDADEVKLYTIDELVPSTSPITIPYLEIYRTNELEFIPYMSPYNVGVSTSSDEEESDSDTIDSDTNTDENNNDDSTNTNGDSSSSDSSSSSS